ncbi:unnamed protein product [marine sediment metagenome]|uniref:Uncharacterized protein n=1 Tax=marine sediment metagenome TaxID=412755 RepID=X1M9T6_9ZZZZ
MTKRDLGNTPSTIDKPGYYDMGFEALFNLSNVDRMTENKE